VKTWISIGDTGARQWSEFKAFCSVHPDCSAETPLDDQDVFYQMYTSGTTGKPKGAMLTHYSVVSNAMQSMPLFKDVLGPGKRILVVMPMFHAGATSFVIGGLLSGSTIVIHREFSARAVAEALSKQNINVVNLVPAMIQAMLDQVPDLSLLDFSTLEVMIYGASSISEHTLKRAMEVFSCEFIQGFGQTETSACISFLSARDHHRALDSKPELLRSAGRPLIGTAVRIVNEQGMDLPPGETGEILMRGPQMMKGYWNLPDATSQTIRNGWLHTGDAGCLDDEGYLYVQDRLKDMIISGGENVYSREVENVLHEHPAIMDVAVIGLPDQYYGEVVTAVLVLREGCDLGHEELKEFCRGKLGRYKIPRQLRIVQELPRNSSGKVQKAVLRGTFGKASQALI
jgi:acyl-CoA synthetase (AMP-forming)/AMP-acid ligase II